MESCHCISFSCSGKLVSRKTLRRHAHEDRLSMAASNRLAGQSGTIGSFDSVVDPSLYQTHWTAREKISESSDVTVLEMLYQISRDFAMAPGASKHWVSQQLMLLKKNFLSHKDDFPETFEQLVEILDPFLPPMHTFDVCVNDCIIFRKENEFDVNCPVCGEDSKKTGKHREDASPTYL